MVGGLSFMVDGAMCCGVTSAGLMVRLGPEESAQALTKPPVRPMEMAGRSLSGFVVVEPPGYGTQAALTRWVQRGIEFSSTLPAKEVRRTRAGP